MVDALPTITEQHVLAIDTLPRSQFFERETEQLAEVLSALASGSHVLCDTRTGVVIPRHKIEALLRALVLACDAVDALGRWLASETAPTLREAIDAARQSVRKP